MANAYDLPYINMNTILLMDIGGTHTRCRIIESGSNTDLIPRNIINLSRKINCADHLFEFITEIITRHKLQKGSTTAVLCFAGPITDRERIFMTNWSGERHILSSQILACGLLADTTTLVNDLEAAAFALDYYQRNNSFAEQHIVPLYCPDNRPMAIDKNALLIIPGTGIGISAIIQNLTSSPLILACETQHSPIPALDAWHRTVIHEVGQLLGTNHPSWEDFISGRGLETIYQALLKLEGNATDAVHAPDAATIAERAVSGEDELCHSALGIYYRCAGALTQLLALTFRPYGGIYLAGNSTRNNAGYLPDSAFIAALHDNDVHRAMLEDFPVYMILTDLNLDGASYLAEQSLQQSAQISLFA